MNCPICGSAIQAGMTNCPVCGSPVGTPQPQGSPQNMPQGMTQGVPQGMPRGIPQGMPQGMPQQPYGTPQGTPQGMLQGTPQGYPQQPYGAPQGQPQGMLQGTPQEMSQGTPQGMLQGTPQGMPQVMPQGYPQQPPVMPDGMQQNRPKHAPVAKGKKKSHKGLIIGIISAVVVLATAAILLIFVFDVFSGKNGTYKLQGAAEGQTMELKADGEKSSFSTNLNGSEQRTDCKVTFDDTRVTVSAHGNTLEGTYNKEAKTITFTREALLRASVLNDRPGGTYASADNFTLKKED